MTIWKNVKKYKTGKSSLNLNKNGSEQNVLVKKIDFFKKNLMRIQKFQRKNGSDISI